MPTVMHLVSLRGVAGVEVQFAEFIARAACRYPQWRHALLSPTREAPAALLRGRLEAALTHSARTKYRYGIKLPARPASLRSSHCRRVFEETGADLLVIWNRTARINFVIDAFGSEGCVHWEHGAAWFPGRERDRERYLGRIPLAIANSGAAARVLQLLWDYRGEVRVCRNALRPSLMPKQPAQKRYPAQRPIRLGVATRLSPVKGVSLILHALERLAGRGSEIELHIAGEGPELSRLRSLAQRLGVAAAVRFHGFVDDMAGFYRQVDCLVHVPLTEAFGLVTIEAAAHGCPVIAAAVDGLPEAVAEGISGHCVAPTLPLTEYADLGGTVEDLPPYVYDPVADALCEPRVVEPTALAERIAALFASEEAYERLSLSASEHVLQNLRFDAHVDEVLGVLGGALAGKAESADDDRAVPPQP